MANGTQAIRRSQNTKTNGRRPGRNNNNNNNNNDDDDNRIMQSFGIERGWTSQQSRSFLWQQHQQHVISIFFDDLSSHATNNATGGNGRIVEGQCHEDGESCARVCHHDTVLQIWKKNVWRGSLDFIMQSTQYFLY